MVIYFQGYYSPMEFSPTLKSTTLVGLNFYIIIGSSLWLCPDYDGGYTIEVD